MNEDAIDLWLTRFDTTLQAGDVAGAVELFRPDAAPVGASAANPYGNLQDNPYAAAAAPLT